MILVLILAFVATSEQCCMPTSWEGTLEKMIAEVVRGHSRLTKVSSKISFDVATKNMTVMKGSGSSRGYNFEFESYIDYNKGITYTVMNGKCIKTPNALPYMGNCVDDSHETSHGYIGVEEGKRAIKTYQVHAGVFTIDFTVDAMKCVVIDQVLYNANQLQPQRFINVTTGIKDASVFDIPTICDHSKAN